MMPTMKDNFESGFGYSNMMKTFMRAGLQPPLIPQPLRGKIFVQDKWCWGSWPLDPFEMYMMSNGYIAELLNARNEDCVAVSHAGHGLNSYGLQTTIAFGPVVLILQNTFGGVYNDKDEAVRSISQTYNHVRKLLSIIPHERGVGVDRYRVVVVWSEFREISQYVIQDLADLTADYGNVYDGSVSEEHECSIDMEQTSVDRIVGLRQPWRRVGEQIKLFRTAEKELRRILQEGKR